MTPFTHFYIENFSFDADSGKATFSYSFDKDISFIEEIEFYDEQFPLRKDIKPEDIQTFLFSLSLALGVSYYKSYPTHTITVETGALTDAMKTFWKKFYTLGLGEFFYRNSISPDILKDIVSTSTKTYQKTSFIPEERAIVPVGGGKDSIVTIEKVKSGKVPFNLFTFGKDNSIYHDMEEISGAKRLFVRRSLAKELFRLNSEGYYNGHVPITGVISFALALVSYLYGYKYIIFSNEHSANFGNMSYENIEVNHQYSKSLEFENDFRAYLRDYVSTDIEYFSMMRPYYEINILKMFSNYKDYFPYFSSCNRNFHLLASGTSVKRWCLECPKCAFTFAGLHPYLSKEEMFTIFGGDMYADTRNIPLFRELAGVSGHKPFECVGTNEEILVSMAKSIENVGDTPFPPILEDIQEKALSHMSADDIENRENTLFARYENNIPALFSSC
jgi:hypothetical protein